MSSNSSIDIGVVDYTVIGSSFAVCLIISWLSNRQQIQNENKVSEYFLGSRNISFLPAAISMAATFLSSSAITGQSGETFRFGLQYYSMIVSFSLFAPVLAFTVLPVFHKAQFVSIYEFLERRFDHKLRKLVSGFYTINIVLTLALTLYAPSVSLVFVTGWPYWSVVSIGGLICTLYSAVGGFRAVIWTDVFQGILMIGSILLVIAFGVNKNGGFQSTFAKAFNGTNAQQIILYENGSNRYSFWALISSGFVYSLDGCIGNQAGAQRFLSVKGHGAAIKCYLFGIGLFFIFQALLFVQCVVLLSVYFNCDPLQLPEETKVTTDDQLFIFGAVQFLGEHPGLIGMALVALISASLSSFSSYINSAAAMTLEDFLRPLFPNFFQSDRVNINACRFLTTFYGLAAMSLSFIVPHIGGIVRAMITFSAALDGPKVAVITVGLFFKTANSKVKTLYQLKVYLSLFKLRTTLDFKMKYCRFMESR